MAYISAEYYRQQSGNFPEHSLKGTFDKSAGAPARPPNEFERKAEQAESWARKAQEIADQIALNEEVINQITERRDAARKAFDHFERTGEFRPGDLEDPKVQELIADWEERTGTDFDTLSDQGQYIALQNQLEEEKRREDDLRAKNEQLGENYGVAVDNHQTYDEKAQEMAEKIDGWTAEMNDPNTSPERAAELQKQIDQELEGADREVVQIARSNEQNSENLQVASETYEQKIVDYGSLGFS